MPKTNGQPHDHHSHSGMIRHWNAKSIENWASQDALNRSQGKTFTLKSPFQGYMVRISFTTYPTHPDRMRVRSTNWRCEYEPSGIYKIEECRAFWKKLIAAGFVQVETQE